MDEHTKALAALLHDFGEDWQIEIQSSPPAWVGIRRPTVSQLHVLVALDLPGLREKITAAVAAER